MNSLQNAEESSRKVNIMECDPGINFGDHSIFSQNLTQYIIMCLQWNFEKNLWCGSVYIKFSTEVLKKIS